MNDYYNPVKILTTNDWLLELNNYKEKLLINSPIIITSEGNRKRLDLDSIFNSSHIYSSVNTNPSFKNCDNAIEFCKENKFDSVIALGGGSVMDLAKVILAYLSTEKSNIFELINYKNDFPKKIPSIFLPTTHGTGSEVTMWGTLWNYQEKKKYSISHKDLYPTMAILDGNLTIDLPLEISITTILDALSHSFESIWNKNSNPISTNYAIEAISIILKNAQKIKNNLSDLEIRNFLLNASNISGLAFSNTKTAAAHSISYPLTINYAIPHGIASSMSLIPLLKINKKSINSSLNKICDMNEINIEELINKIISIPQNIISLKLIDWGVQKNQIDRLVKQSFTKGRMDNNIVDLTENDIKNILLMIYK